VDTAFYHDQSVDLWSLGGILYMLLTGIAPFRGNGAELIEVKKQGIITFDIFAPSDSAQDLVVNLLQVNPRDRLTIDEVLQHEWMTAPDDYLEGFDLSLSLTFIKDWKET
jgi:serine/threonine protein kinase